MVEIEPASEISEKIGVNRVASIRFQPMCQCGFSRATTLPGSTEALRLTVFVRTVRQQLHAQADPDERTPGTGMFPQVFDEVQSMQRFHGGGERADAGQYEDFCRIEILALAADHRPATDGLQRAHQ